MKGMIGGGVLRLKQLLLTISVIFTIYTILLSSLLYLFGYDNIIYNISLILSTVTGGGLLPTSTSISADNTMVLFIIMVGMIISALPFAFHYAIFSKKVKTRRMRPEIYVFLGIIFVSTIIFYFLISSTNISSKLMVSLFHIVSASTNTGFQFIDISSLSEQSKILLIVLMLIGGTAFSTAGGIKVGRILQVVQKLTNKRFAADVSTRSISSTSSRYDNSLNFYETKLQTLKEEKTFREALFVIALFVIFSFVTGIVLMYIEHKDFLDTLFESVSALSTTGITAGITSMNMDNISKVFLIVNMITGRFEIIAVVYLFLGISLRRKR
jgi:trk system potassium uptake protein TrkH